MLVRHVSSQGGPEQSGVAWRVCHALAPLRASGRAAGAHSGSGHDCMQMLRWLNKPHIAVPSFVCKHLRLHSGGGVCDHLLLMIQAMLCDCVVNATGSGREADTVIQLPPSIVHRTRAALPGAARLLCPGLAGKAWRDWSSWLCCRAQHIAIVASQVMQGEPVVAAMNLFVQQVHKQPCQVVGLGRQNYARS
jgi:hypothetical protein